MSLISRTQQGAVNNGDVDDNYLVMPKKRMPMGTFITQCYGRYTDLAHNQVKNHNRHLWNAHYVQAEQPVLISSWRKPDPFLQLLKPRLHPMFKAYAELSPEQIAAYQRDHDKIMNIIIAGHESSEIPFWTSFMEPESMVSSTLSWTSGMVTGLGAQADAATNQLKQLLDEAQHNRQPKNQRHLISKLRI